ncbi:hypothetical protein Nepgr_018863 [Nepenthes gracilis]|uniref:C2H2-type domain-containing protein n=1 Tax=Nepenthes gracilis TaxID=150966 RepID=A0AAD3XTI8_NEPGR|nr:hypothetical protein Nepgr_018863 [Nepenthes gracilis]
MEQGKEFKHVCKFCKKSFPCGRSLGGHMRSHLINSSEKTNENFKKEKPIAINSSDLCYELRENPKKTWRVADSSEEDALLSCRECGKLFPSSKALFGHMKSHSEKKRVSHNNFLADDSWATASNQKLVMDNQSDNKESTAPNQPRRSSRRPPSYKGATTTSSSLSFANNASSSASGIEQEQEEVALSLIMMSKDVGQWGTSTLNSSAESSDYSSLFLEAKQKIEGKDSVSNEGDYKKQKKLTNKILKSEAVDFESIQLVGRRKSELSASGYARNGAKTTIVEVSDNHYRRNDQQKFQIVESKLDSEGNFEAAEVQLRKNLSVKSIIVQGEFGISKINRSKRNLNDSYNAELEMGKSDCYVSELFKGSHQRSEFECTCCNKVFHSYQALGGHKASHKKIKDCSSSRTHRSENSLQTEPSSSRPKPDVELCAAVDGSKKARKHECPICFKVFSSGQALGGHKRYHLIAGLEAKAIDRQSLFIQNPTSEIRDFIDLNLPPAEEDNDRARVQFEHAGLSRFWV